MTSKNLINFHSKHFLVFICIFTMLLGIGEGMAVGTRPPLDPSMVLYYITNSTYINDTTINDSSVNNNIGILNNTIFSNKSGTLYDGEVSFNGINSSIKPINQTFLGHNGTIEFWFKPYYSASTYTVFSSNLKTRFSFQYDPSLQEMTFSLGNPATTSFHSPTNSILLNNNYFVSIVYYTINSTTNNLTMYLNGLYIGDVLFNNTISNANKVRIGSFNDGGSSYMNGTLGDLMIYNYTLGPNIIIGQYQNYTKCSSDLSNCSIISNSIVLNGGSYFISNEVSLYSDNLIIDGNGSIIFYDTSLLGNSFLYGTNLNNVTISNLTIVKSPLNSTMYGHGIELINVSDLVLKNLVFNFSFIGGNYTNTNEIELRSCNYFRIFNSTFNIGTNSDFSRSNSGIFTASSNYSEIHNNIFFINGWQSYGIYVTKSIFNNITNNQVILYGSDSWGIHLESFSKNNSVKNNLVNVSTNININTSYPGTKGILLEDDSTYNFISSNIVNCHNYSSIGIGTASGSDYETISENNINIYRSNYSRGIILGQDQGSLGYGSKFNVISNNHINVFGNLDPYYSYGLAVTSEANKNNLIFNNSIFVELGMGIYLSSSNNNVSYNVINVSGEQRSCIFSLSNSTNNTIFNNKFKSDFYDFRYSSSSDFSIFNGDFSIINRNETASKSYYYYGKKALIYNLNYSFICDGLCNISLSYQSPFNWGLVFDNYSITEGVTRPNDPINLTSNSLEIGIRQNTRRIVIESSLTDSLTLPIYPNNTPCPNSYDSNIALNCSNGLVTEMHASGIHNGNTTLHLYYDNSIPPSTSSSQFIPSTSSILNNTNLTVISNNDTAKSNNTLIDKTIDSIKDIPNSVRKWYNNIERKNLFLIIGGIIFSIILIMVIILAIPKK